jgi:hypothetical protein
MNKKNTIITDWLDKHGDPQIEKRVMERLDKITKELIIDETYENYYNSTKDLTLETLHVPYQKTHLYGTLSRPISNAKFRPYTQEEFINKCKTDSEFSEKWGLKIEERELSLEERCELGYKYVDSFEWDMLMGGGREGDEGNCNDYYIPTKLITITYNDKTIESYE